MIMCFEDYIQSTNQKHVKTHPGYNSRLKLQSLSTLKWSLKLKTSNCGCFCGWSENGTLAVLCERHDLICMFCER